jgi:putative addiction module component (TIGR02574 family)
MRFSPGIDIGVAAMTLREQVLQDALALPAEDRAFVAAQLDQSLPHGEFASPEVAAAWTAEIDRRIAAYDQGEAHAVEADESLTRMRRFLAEHQARKANS